MTDLITRDTDALVTLALTRAGWTEADIRAAILDAAACRIKWPVILTRVICLMRTPDSDPRELVQPADRLNAARAAREDTP